MISHSELSELEEILKQCERELLEMSWVEKQGSDLKDMNFKSPIFRFIWLKLRERKSQGKDSVS